MKRNRPRKSAPRKRASAVAPRAPRVRVAVGPPRPQYLLNAENDRMMMIITALAAEVSALRERLDTHEALGAKRRFASPGAVERNRLGAAQRGARETARTQMLSRVFRVVLEDLEAARSAGETAGAAILADETGAA